MNKILKRLQKIDTTFDNAFVVGSGFGILPELLQLYKTVFVQDTDRPCVHAKNLVYRIPGSELNQLSRISTVFIGLDQIYDLDKIVPRLLSQRPDFLVEGNEIIERDKSEPFYKHGYRAISQNDILHVWKKIK